MNPFCESCTTFSRNVWILCLHLSQISILLFSRFLFYFDATPSCVASCFPLPPSVFPFLFPHPSFSHLSPPVPDPLVSVSVNVVFTFPQVSVSYLCLPVGMFSFWLLEFFSFDLYFAFVLGFVWFFFVYCDSFLVFLGLLGSCCSTLTIKARCCSPALPPVCFGPRLVSLP